MDRGSWWATVHGVAKGSDKTESLSTQAVEFLMGGGAVIKIIICLISEPLAESLHLGGVSLLSSAELGMQCIQAQSMSGEEVKFRSKVEGDLRHIGLLHGFSGTDLQSQRGGHGGR